MDSKDLGLFHMTSTGYLWPMPKLCWKFSGI